MFDEIARGTPNLCKIIPAGTDEMADVDRAGGIPAVLNRLKDMLKDSPTVNGNTISVIAEEGEVLDDDVIRSLGNAHFPFGSCQGVLYRKRFVGCDRSEEDCRG
jgi:dihydroxy-acid dehydratase